MIVMDCVTCDEAWLIWENYVLSSHGRRLAHLLGSFSHQFISCHGLLCRIKTLKPQSIFLDFWQKDSPTLPEIQQPQYWVWIHWYRCRGSNFSKKVLIWIEGPTVLLFKATKSHISPSANKHAIFSFQHTTKCPLLLFPIIIPARHHLHSAVVGGHILFSLSHVQHRV